MYPRTTLFIGNFFFALFTALTFYVLLPYLSSFMPEAYASLVVACGGLIAVIFFLFLPDLVAKYGAQWLGLVFVTAQIVALFILASLPGAVMSTLLVMLTIALQPFIAYELDLLLEATMNEKSVAGRLRALFLTAWNTGVLTAPLLLGVILDGSDAYGRVFLVGALVLIPLTALLARQRLPKGVPPRLSHFRDTLISIAHDRDLAAVTFGHLLLWLFYVWAPLYVPIYLHNVLGMSWTSLGWIFFVMLLPYVLIEYPAGWVADTFLGDKKLMLVGFIIAGMALASVSLLSSTSSLSLILLILVGSRVGTALVESMTEGHFFRRVSRRDITSMSVFRGVWPLAYIIAPVVGSIILLFGTYQMLFIITGTFIALAGALTTLFIRDGHQSASM